MLGGGEPERHVLDTFQRFVKAGDVVLDVGANIGTHTFALAALVGPEGRVYAVEADSDNVASLRLSIEASAERRIVVLAVAASDKVGTVAAWSSEGTNSKFSERGVRGGGRVAKTAPLDDLLDDDIALIKLDVEGMELLALRGLSRTIARSRPVVISEFSPYYIADALGHDYSEDFFDFFRSRDFVCFYLDPFRVLNPIEDYAELIAAHAAALERFNWHHIDLVFLPREHPKPAGAAVPDCDGRKDRRPMQCPSITMPNHDVQALDEQALDALAERMMPLVLERLRAEKPWRDNVYVPAPDVVYVPPTEPFLPYSTCCVRDFLHPRFARIIELMQHSLVLHRKLWENVFIFDKLEKADVVRSPRRGLGFGVGKEMLPAVFAAAGASITATDAPPEIGAGAGWTLTDEWAPGLDDLPTGNLSREEFRRRVSWRTCDMNAIEPDLSGYDFCWSSCCLEHLGSLGAGADFIVNSVEKTLKLGGVAVHTTEFNLSSNSQTIETGQTVLYRRRDLEALIATLRRRGHQVDDLVIAPDLLSLGGYIDTPPYAAPHVRLALSGYTTTSVGLVIRRGK